MRSLLFFTAMIFLFACGDDTPTVAEQLDEFMNNNPGVMLDSMQTSNGRIFYFEIQNAGGSEKPTPANSVRVTYEGAYTDGEIFDGNENLAFPLANTILGWQAGIPLIGRDGVIKLVIPPNLGYGPSPNNGIRNNAVLVFNVELHDFN